MGDGISFNKSVKGVKYEVGVEVGGSVGWCFDICVGAAVDIVDEIILPLDYRSNMVSHNWFIYDLNDGKIVGLLLDESLK